MGVLTYGRQYRVQFEENSFVFGNVPDEVIEVVFDQEVCLVHQSGQHLPQVGVSPPFLQGLRHTTRSALATINLCNSSLASICEIHGWMLGQKLLLCTKLLVKLTSPSSDSAGAPGSIFGENAPVGALEVSYPEARTS